jgi:biopolymer transport protein ExbD
MSEINTTPLVDVMLVLLVIFIITAPLFYQAVPIDLPRVEASRVDDQPRVLQVALDAEGRTYVNGAVVAAQDLEARLRAEGSANPQGTEMHLRADRATRYERVAEIMAAAQRAGITRLAFVTQKP